MKLYIDHFYVSLPSPVFKQLAEVAELNSYFNHKVVKSGKDSWEGVYLSTKSKFYLEFVIADKEIKKNYSGLAVSTLNQSKKSQLGKFLASTDEFQEGFRMGPTGKKWFHYWYSNKSKRGFWLWAMHYFGNSLNTRNNRMKKSPILGLETYSLTLPTKQFEAMAEGLHWCPLHTRIGSKSIRISDGRTTLNVKKGESLEIKIKLKSTKSAKWNSYVGSRVSFRSRGEFVYLSLK